jgi:hypothetical protein
MGKCASTIDDKNELRQTGFFENQPLAVKSKADDYSFLIYPKSDIKE